MVFGRVFGCLVYWCGGLVGVGRWGECVVVVFFFYLGFIGGLLGVGVGINCSYWGVYWF